jgi:NADH:ubiquinone oxidoreductase subunit K
MKYCKNCGSELPDDAAFCAKCGTPASAAEQPVQSVQPTQTVQQTPPPNAQPNTYHSYNAYNGTGQVPYQKTNGLSVAGFVVSLIGILTSFYIIGIVIGLVGMILSIIGTSKVKQSGEKGKGLAIAVIIIGALAIVIGILAIFVYYYWWYWYD